MSQILQEVAGKSEIWDFKFLCFFLRILLTFFGGLRMSTYFVSNFLMVLFFGKCFGIVAFFLFTFCIRDK